MRDGVENLQRRNNTKLWYRQPLGVGPVVQEVQQQTPAEQAVASSFAPSDLATQVIGEPNPVDDYALLEADDDYAYFELDTTGMKLRTLNFDDPHVLRSLRGTPVSAGQLAWRAYPADATALTLSATENLHTRLLGPVLSSGIRYRVVDNYNGVVAIEIERLGLPPMRGYCLAADLEAAELSARPKRSGRQVDWIRSVSDRVSQTFGVIDISISSVVAPSGPAGHLPPLGGVSSQD
jgi:hypothetical protein